MSQVVTKPWGFYEDIFRSEQCVFKRIVIAPGCGISYQTHENRDEVWYIIAGEGYTKIGPPGVDPLKNFSIEEVGVDDQITVPRMYAHQIWNNGEKDLVFYEMQVGLCEESDIQRLDDPYNRELS